MVVHWLRMTVWTLQQRGTAARNSGKTVALRVQPSLAPPTAAAVLEALLPSQLHLAAHMGATAAERAAANMVAAAAVVLVGGGDVAEAAMAMRAVAAVVADVPMAAAVGVAAGAVEFHDTPALGVL